MTKIQDSHTISVVIPMYNVASYLEKCLESVITQSYSNLEIICINDGSPDNSLDIAKKYAVKDNRFVIVDKKNEGVSIARNEGINIARGQYIFFLDGDDWLDKQFFEYFYKNAIHNDSDIVILCSFWNLDKRFTDKYFTAVPNCAMFIKRSILDKNKDLLYTANMQPGEDGVFSHMLFTQTKKISFEPLAIYHYVKREGQDHIRSIKEPQILVDAIDKWFLVLSSFYESYKLWESHSLSFAKYVEQEAFLAFRSKPFNVKQERIIFNLLKDIMNRLIPNIEQTDYQYFSKEFVCFIESNTIKQYYTKVKYRYNYIRLKILGIRFSTRYNENRIKHFIDDTK